MKKHADEIKAWANNPDGTKVWCKRKGDKNWVLQKAPSWLPINEYVVDGPRAIEQMQEIEKREEPAEIWAGDEFSEHSVYKKFETRREAEEYLKGMDTSGDMYTTFYMKQK